MAARTRATSARGRRPGVSNPAHAAGTDKVRSIAARPARDSVASGANAVRPALLARGTAALARILQFDMPADVALHRFFQQHADLGRRDRGFIAETVFACLRRLRWYSHLAESRDARRLFLLAAERLPASEHRDLGYVLGEQERAWLSGLAGARDDALELGVRAELPDWAVEALRASCDDQAILSLGRGMQVPAPLDLRVNTVRSNRDEVLAALLASDIVAHPTPYSPVGIRLQAKPALERHPLYLTGAVEVQDEGSQLLGYLLAPKRREMVADFCAGAGGKTLLLGALMRSEGRLYAFDVSAHRIRRLHARLARSGLSNVQPETIAQANDVRLKRLAGKLARVLVDAPCTGFGTLRRNPDLKWRQTPADLAALIDKQSAILAAASRLLGPNGRLVYATCSFLPAENDAIVDAFLRNNGEFAELNAGEVLARQGIAIDVGKRLQLFPHRHGTDGFFAAVLERRAPVRPAA
jgi:16S rRNA (cytosine967-C5)-methyltransferase